MPCESIFAVAPFDVVTAVTLPFRFRSTELPSACIVFVPPFESFVVPGELPALPELAVPPVPVFAPAVTVDGFVCVVPVPVVLFALLVLLAVLRFNPLGALGSAGTIEFVECSASDLAVFDLLVPLAPVFVLFVAVFVWLPVPDELPGFKPEAPVPPECPPDAVVSPWCSAGSSGFGGVGLAGFVAGAGVLFGGGEFNDDDDEDFGFFSCADTMVGSARKNRIRTNDRRYFVQDAELGFMSFSSSDLVFRRSLNFCSSRVSAHLRVLNTFERSIAHSVTAPADSAFFQRFSQVTKRG